MRDGGASVLYRAVLFDFDGTLAPSLPLWVKAYRIALEQCAVLIHNADRLRATEPDHIFGDHRELLPLLGLPDLATQEQPA